MIVPLGQLGTRPPCPPGGYVTGHLFFSVYAAACGLQQTVQAWYERSGSDGRLRNTLMHASVNHTLVFTAGPLSVSLHRDWQIIALCWPLLCVQVRRQIAVVANSICKAAFIYIDGLLQKLNDSKVGCWIGSLKCLSVHWHVRSSGWYCSIVYSPTPRAMRLLLQICENYGREFSIHSLMQLNQPACLLAREPIPWNIRCSSIWSTGRPTYSWWICAYWAWQYYCLSAGRYYGNID